MGLWVSDIENPIQCLYRSKMPGFSKIPSKTPAETRSSRDLIHRLKLIQTIGWIVLASVYFLIGFIWYWGIANQWGVISGVLWWLVIRQFTRRIQTNQSNILITRNR